MKIPGHFGFSLLALALPASLLLHDSLICPQTLRVSLSAALDRFFGKDES